MFRLVVDLLMCWNRRVSQDDINIVGNAIPYFLIQCIWRERNARSFNDQERTSLDLQNCFLKSLFQWISSIAFLHVSSYADFSLFFLTLDYWVFILYGFYSAPCTFNEFPLLIKNKTFNPTYFNIN
jgi:hypothetical protein